MSHVELQSILTCPQCGHRASETMPTDACQYFYDCKGCGGVLKPRAGDCCVFCSYGDVACPPMQAGGPPHRKDDLRIDKRSSRHARHD
jgi:hypothetical protein